VRGDRAETTRTDDAGRDTALLAQELVADRRTGG
jgi:hypothetical protein